jgi:hypothetical protein
MYNKWTRGARGELIVKNEARLFWRLHRAWTSERVVIKRSASRRELVFGARASASASGVFTFSAQFVRSHTTNIRQREREREREKLAFFI